MHSSELFPFQPTLFILLAVGTHLGLESMLSDSDLKRIAVVGCSRNEKLIRYDGRENWAVACVK